MRAEMVSETESRDRRLDQVLDSRPAYREDFACRLNRLLDGPLI
jgi:hypothetical protein